MGEDPGRVEAVARCLAKLDGKHVGASDWAGSVGAAYRDKAAAVLLTLSNYDNDNGIRSGGLPMQSERWALERTVANYATHSILHRDFPPKPDRCTFCDCEGLDLYSKPCPITQLEEPHA